MNREAQCACGHLKVVVSGDPEMSYACHCDYCQKATGSIAAFGAVYLEERFISIEGEAAEFKDFPKWPGAIKYFCKNCGTTVHWINPQRFQVCTWYRLGAFPIPIFPLLRFKYKLSIAINGVAIFLTLLSVRGSHRLLFIEHR